MHEIADQTLVNIKTYMSKVYNSIEWSFSFKISLEKRDSRMYR